MLKYWNFYNFVKKKKSYDYELGNYSKIVSLSFSPLSFEMWKKRQKWELKGDHKEIEIKKTEIKDWLTKTCN